MCDACECVPHTQTNVHFLLLLYLPLPFFCSFFVKLSILLRLLILKQQQQHKHKTTSTITNDGSNNRILYFRIELFLSYFFFYFIQLLYLLCICLPTIFLVYQYIIYIKHFLDVRVCVQGTRSNIVKKYIVTLMVIIIFMLVDHFIHPAFLRIEIKLVMLILFSNML